MNPSAPPTAKSARSVVERRLRQAGWVSLVALIIHLAPLLWLNEGPESRLERARDTRDFVKRAEILRPLETDERSSPAQLRAAAAMLLTAGASGDARYLAEEAERREPRAFDNQLLLARIFAMERMPRALERAVQRAAELSPEDPRPAMVLAEFLRREGDASSAIEALTDARRRAPDSVALSVQLAEALIASGQLERADALLVAIPAEKITPELLVALGDLRARQRRFEEARGVLERALELNPALGEGHYLLGAVAYQRGDLISAERAFRAAGRFSPEDVRPLAALCSLQEDTGRIEAARATGIELRRRFPTHIDLLRGVCRSG